MASGAIRRPGAAFRSGALPVLTATAALFIADLAGAESDPAAAEALFRHGRELLDAGRTSDACPKFAESYELEPATGTLLGLALCKERDGKLATAWAKYVDVEGRASREGDTDRVAFAKQKIGELAPRLSVLTLEVPEGVASTPGLELRRNGTLVGRGAWGVPVPVDGGDYLFEVSAPGKQAWTTKVTIAVEGDNTKVLVPALVDELTALAPAPQPGGTPHSDPIRADTGMAERPWYGKMTTTRWVGVGAASVGVVALGFGGYFVNSALDLRDASEGECLGDTCTRSGADFRSHAATDADLATAFGIAGVVLVGAGAVLFFAPSEDVSGLTPAMTLVAGPSGVVARLGGAF